MDPNYCTICNKEKKTKTFLRGIEWLPSMCEAQGSNPSIALTPSPKRKKCSLSDNGR